MSKYREDWREIAKVSERDPKALDILENGPKSLSQAYFLQAIRYKYGQKGK